MLTHIAGNNLLASLSEGERRRFKEILSPVRLEAGQNLYMQGDAVEQIYFPIDGVVASLAILEDGATVEVGLVGKEGLTGVVSVFGDYAARNWTRVLLGGEALRAGVEDVRRLSGESKAVERQLIDYYRSIITQTSQRAVCNGRHTLLQRLSTWLLMVHDRAGRDDLALTQEQIASHLGSRRAGVTQAARVLLLSHALVYKRGKIHVEHRELLEEVAGECYRVQQAEFWGTKKAGNANPTPTNELKKSASDPAPTRSPPSRPITSSE